MLSWPFSQYPCAHRLKISLSMGFMLEFAAGASEPRNLSYMDRLGLWGEGTPAFPQFSQFLEAVGGRGVGALELVAMDMKARGMYVCRTLSFAGATRLAFKSAAVLKAM